MIRNYIKSAWRNIIRDKTFSLINVFGLAIGLAICFLIGLYIKHQLSFDTFHKNSDNIYRVYIHGRYGGNEFKAPRTSNVTKEALLSEFSEVEQATRFAKFSQLIEYNDKRIVENDLMYADSDFLKVFTFPLIDGDPENALSKPHQIVLTESTAEKYFGDKNPMGEVIRVGGERLFQVSAICEDVPDNSHVSFDMLLSYSSSPMIEIDTWSQQSIFTYILLNKNINPEQFEKKLDVLVTDHAAADFKQAGNDLGTLDPESEFYNFKIQPLEDIYLHSDLDYEIEAVGDISTVWFFSAIALFVLLIACINFMNLATARFSNRAKEVGIRKVLGSKKQQLIIQFLTESVLIVLAALFIGTSLFEFALPAFNNLIQQNLEINYLSKWYILPALFGFAVFIGVLAGSYPALFLSSFNPVKILKGSYNKGIGGTRLRGVLVTIQFVITISLFVSTYIIFKQNHFMANKDMGFDQERLLVIENATSLNDNIHPFINELRKYPQVSKVTGSYNIPGKGYSGYTMRKMNKPEDGHFNFVMNFVDEKYLNTLDINLKKGRGFTGNYASDTGTVVVNQSAVKMLGYKDPVGKYLMISDNEKVKIVGVLKDFNFNSLHKEINPLAITFYDGPYYRYVAVKIKPGKVKETIKLVKNDWGKYVSDFPFQFYFMDDAFDQMYHSEKKTAALITIFSLLAIFIACLGLLGLSAFTAQKRVKEIGIRKVMGAELSQILFILYKEILMLLIIATAIAWPLSYFIMSGWLDNFAFKINPGLLPFLISTFGALVVAVSVTSIQALKAAWTNPAHTLRDE